MLVTPRRSFFIDNEEIINRIGHNSIEFSFNKDKGGDLTIVATLSDSGHKIFKSSNRIRFNTPSIFKECYNRHVEVYIERLRPLSNEAFRVRPIGFKLSGSRLVKYDPYFTDSGAVIPQMYINRNLGRGVYYGLALSFEKTTISTLMDGYLIAELRDVNGGKKTVDEYRLRECGAGLRTGSIKHTHEFLRRHAKNINNYTYRGTMEGLLFFKE